MKRIVSLFIALLLLTGCSVQNLFGENLPNEPFAIYLAKEPSLSKDKNANMGKLTLEALPILTDTHIIAYYPKEGIIKYEAGALDTTVTGLEWKDLINKQFVVVSAKKRIFAGLFWSNLYSAMPPKAPHIYAEDFLGNDTMLKDALQEKGVQNIVCTEEEKLLKIWGEDEGKNDIFDGLLDNLRKTGKLVE